MRPYYPIAIVMSLALSFCTASVAADAPQGKEQYKEIMLIARIIYDEGNEIIENTKDPIAQDLSKCAEKDGGTAGLNECYSDAINKYDEILNETYDTVMKSLDENEKQLLRDSERKWITFIQADAKLQAKLTDGKPAANSPITLQSRIITLRKRIADLLIYEQ